MNETLKQLWERVCNTYLHQFCIRHDFDYIENSWVSDEPGTIAIIGDMFVDMRHIRYDVDNSISEEKFEEWYWRNDEIYELTGSMYMPYEEYCEGRRVDVWNEEKIKQIRTAKQRVFDAQQDLETIINEYKDEINNKG